MPGPQTQYQARRKRRNPLSGAIHWETKTVWRNEAEGLQTELGRPKGLQTSPLGAMEQKLGRQTCHVGCGWHRSWFAPRLGIRAGGRHAVIMLQ